MKIIIAGAGEVGTHLAKMLSYEYHDLVVIDDDEQRRKQLALNVDVPCIAGSPSSFEMLSQAGVEKADLFIAVTPSEETNIISASLAKRLGARKVIARIDKNEYLLPSNKEVFVDMGIDYLYYPEKIAGREVVDLLSQSFSTEFVDFANKKLKLIVFKLEDSSPIINKTLLQATASRTNLNYRAVAISRNGETIIPTATERFKVGDIIYVITNEAGAPELVRYTGKSPLEIKNVMILGGSRIGIWIARDLENKVGVKMVEISRDRCQKLVDELPHTLVLNGDGRNSDFLIEEGLEHVDAFIAVTGNSEINILACMLAKRLGVRKTIAEIENLDYIKLAESVGVDTVINKKLITAGRIFRFTMSTDVQSIKVLSGSDAEVMEFIVKPSSPAVRGPVKTINFPKDAMIGGLVRGDLSIIVTGDTVILPYDRVVVFALPSAINKIGRYFN
ncbi:Trk system potassium transporter TrkA [Acetobacteroides hydrogenigenes]|uniref:Trk system potassium uptake protein TrkA n=1 Tax=Acetobacteroides hydrogenigenes TaxID=979970 RepID=A0A4R2EEX3_9BACT|nr:Trk system potassium transporter TrkA [Acetobacteroides hydrogenigenes]TCN65686.1 trk system potassium uptake protein TrkA [Acetobacteroides hydrogenigenes]